MREAWVELEEFPDYAAGNLGSIVNLKTGTYRKISINQQGLPKVSLYKGNQLITRSLAIIIADCFVPRPANEHFNTPINLDGDRVNCRSDNLMWRPRWFAIQYHKQFRYENFYAKVHIVELESGVEYHSIQEACMANGLYWHDVLKSYIEETFVPITYQEFRKVE